MLFIIMYTCRTNEGTGNECYYSRDGNLIVGPPGEGQFEDILPYIFCCKGIQTSCDIYYQRCPSDNRTAYNPPIPGKYVSY